jgi:hypothetical protein
MKIAQLVATTYKPGSCQLHPIVGQHFRLSIRRGDPARTTLRQAVQCPAHKGTEGERIPFHSVGSLEQDRGSLLASARLRRRRRPPPCVRLSPEGRGERSALPSVACRNAGTGRCVEGIRWRALLCVCPTHGSAARPAGMKIAQLVATTYKPGSCQLHPIVGQHFRLSIRRGDPARATLRQAVPCPAHKGTEGECNPFHSVGSPKQDRGSRLASAQRRRQRRPPPCVRLSPEGRGERSALPSVACRDAETGLCVEGIRWRALCVCPTNRVVSAGA